MAQRISGTTDIGTSKTQSLMNLKADLRGWGLNGVESLKPVDPLHPKGISQETHQDESAFLGENSSKPRDEVFESETYRYLKPGSVVSSWMTTTLSNPTSNKSKVATQRNTEQVRTLTSWPGGEPQKGYTTGSDPYTFQSDFQVQDPAVVTKTPTATVKLGKSKDTVMARDKMAGLIYQTRWQQNGYPGGQEVASLEYDTKFEEALGLIPFCITTITPDHRTYLNFPAYLDSYDDSYTGNWDSIQYVGRAENFYGYTGFVRDINLSFKVVIFRKEDLEEMYHRLNRLVGATAPSYDETGLFMRGTLASLTIGDLLRHKPGIVRGVKLSWDTDYLWEIGEVEGSNIPAGPYRVPFALNVSMQFTPIEEKVVTEDNGDYFVFRTDRTVTVKQESAPEKQPGPEKEAPPASREQHTEPWAIPETPIQRDNTATPSTGKQSSSNRVSSGNIRGRGSNISGDDYVKKDPIKDPNAPIPEWRKQLGLNYGQ